MIKGYEFAKGQYVTFTDEEIKELSEKASPAIEITEFVPLSEVEPIFYEKAYFLGPEKGSERAYRLLAEAMKKTGRSALAKYAARGKQYLVMLRPYQDGLVMQELNYADEVKDFSEVPLGENVELKPGELDLAVQLIDQIAADEFVPQKYEDDVRKRIWSAIQQKVEGKEVTIEEEAPKAQIIDLMEALKASLGSAGAESKPAAGSARRKQAASG
jgi:DNA end-binding protein Ku